MVRQLAVLPSKDRGWTPPASVVRLLGARDVVLRRRAGAGFPTPEQAEAGSMPMDDGVGLDDSRLLSGLHCTVFDCVVRALSPFGIVREDLSGLRWGTPASGIKNIRRRFFANNPDLTAEINQTEYPKRFQRMTYSQLSELRRKIKKRMSRANMIAWRLDGYRHVRQFRSLTLQEVGERCFPFMTLPLFDRVRK